MLQKLEYLEHSTNMKIAELFPYIGGTSVGGMISILLNIPGKDGRPFYSVKDISSLLSNAEQIFPKGKMKKLRNLINHGLFFERSGLRKVLTKLVEKAVGHADLTMGDLIGNVGVMTFNNDDHSPVFISKEEHPTVNIIDAMLSTSAAPVYFSENTLHINQQKFNLGDGGIPDNNPVWYVYGMFARNKQPNQVAKILSLGTGIYKENLPKSDELPNWITIATLLGFAMTSRTISQNFLMKEYFLAKSTDVVQYCRLQHELPVSIDLSSSEPLAVPFDVFTDCLPISYYGDKKVLDFENLTKTLASKKMLDFAFTSYLSDMPIRYSPIDYYEHHMRKQEEEFENNWILRSAKTFSAEDDVWGSLNESIKLDIFKFVYEVLLGIAVVYYDRSKIEKTLDFIEKIRLVTKVKIKAVEKGVNKVEEINKYVEKIDFLLGKLQSCKENDLPSYMAEDLEKIDREGYFSRKPRVFAAKLILEIAKRAHSNYFVSTSVDFLESLTHNESIVNKTISMMNYFFPEAAATTSVDFVKRVQKKAMQILTFTVNKKYSSKRGRETLQHISLREKIKAKDENVKDRYLCQEEQHHYPISNEYNKIVLESSFSPVSYVKGKVLNSFSGVSNLSLAIVSGVAGVIIKQYGYVACLAKERMMNVKATAKFIDNMLITCSKRKKLEGNNLGVQLLRAQSHDVTKKLLKITKKLDETEKTLTELGDKQMKGISSWMSSGVSLVDSARKKAANKAVETCATTKKVFELSGSLLFFSVSCVKAVYDVTVQRNNLDRQWEDLREREQQIKEKNEDASNKINKKFDIIP